VPSEEHKPLNEAALPGTSSSRRRPSPQCLPYKGYSAEFSARARALPASSLP
jgi:hypothetical protein